MSDDLVHGKYIEGGYREIRHPVTRRFVCKIDFERDIMYVKDRGREAVIDLAQVRDSAMETIAKSGT